MNTLSYLQHKPYPKQRQFFTNILFFRKKPELKLPLKPYMKCEKKKCLAKFYLNGQNEENGNSYMQTLNEWNQKISM